MVTAAEAIASIARGRGVNDALRHIVDSPCFHKISNIMNCPLFSFSLFLLNLRLLLSPYFDHDAFMHHALQDAHEPRKRKSQCLL